MNNQEENLLLNGNDSSILGALANDLRAPLLQISYLAELAQATGSQTSLSEIELIAKAAMTDIDSLLLGLRSSVGQLELPLQSMSPSAVIYDTLQTLSPYAKRYRCGLNADVQKRTIAMINPGALTYVLKSLSQTLIKLGSGLSTKPMLHLDCHLVKGRPEVQLLFDGEIGELLKNSVNRAEQFSTVSKITKPQLISSGAASLFVVQQLVDSMQAKLKLISKSNSHGFSLSLMPSNQLSLI